MSFKLSKQGTLRVSKIHNMDCLEGLDHLPDEFVNCVISSPPYNAGQEYETRLSNEEYETFITSVFSKLYRILKVDGRICWIIAPTISRKDEEFPFPLEYITMKAAERASLLFWETIVWDQLHSEAKTAWGSWQSASAPHIRHKTERILLFVKQTRKRLKKCQAKEFREKEFEESTLDLWTIAPETRRKIHPCPFPVILVERCLKLFTYPGDVVLDPFAGSGTVKIACDRWKRKFIGFEINSEYLRKAASRINQKTIDTYL